ncbi:MAG: PHP domain-containing protein, partial [Acidobacteria bacterium]|nr:PHP domain-containing protein [Acidobacteriota bacterium]
MVDTHVHTCLSPCAELDMHPAALVDAAVRVGLDSVAVCDHNSAENVGAVQRAARAAGLAVIPGMEITSAEEVHILGLLPD